MYRSQLDDAAPPLEFEFDPLRPCHAHADATLRWPEYPYKQVVIDRLRAKFLSPPLSEDAAAGALLLARGDLTRAAFEVEQHYHYEEEDGEKTGDGRRHEAATSNSGWLALESRFRQERDAFRAAKRAFIRGETQKVAATLDAFATRQRDAEEREALDAWKRRQFVKRYENGDKYEGEVLDKSGVLVPHGQGTLSVPLQSGLGAAIGEIKRIPRYVGAWVDGMRHGRGKMFWRNGDAWEGTFRRDELQGKGVFSFGFGDDDEWDDTLDSSRERERETRVRYYDASQHVCWGDELVLGRRLRLFDRRRYGDPLAAIVRRQDVALESETEFVILQYDEKMDRHLLRRDGSEDTRWVSLSNVSFRLLPSRPITRLDPS